LKKWLPHYKGWEEINYTISISYRNWDKKDLKFFLFNNFLFSKKNGNTLNWIFFSKYSCYDPFFPHTTSDKENVKTTIKAPQAILTIYIFVYFLWKVNLKDVTHVASMTKILVRKMGIRVHCVGTYCKHDAEWFNEL